MARPRALLPRTAGPLLPLIAILSCLACGERPGPVRDAGADAGADSDSDVDIDIDVDADADADSGPGDADLDAEGDADQAVEPPSCRAPTGRPLRVFFVGNSFTLGGPIPDLVRSLAESAGWPAPEVAMSAYGGYTLERHRETASSVDGVRAGGWDAVVLQELSTRPTDAAGDPARFEADATWFHDEALAASPGARVALYETWARHPDHDIYPGTFADPAQMQAELRLHYYAAAEAYIPGHSALGPATDVVVAPAGDAWERHLAGPSPVRLHAEDDYHAGRAGQYLNALVIYSTVYGCRAAGLASLGLEPAVAAALQASADETTGEVGLPPADRLPPLAPGGSLRVDLGEVLTGAPGWNDLASASGELRGAVSSGGAETRCAVAVTDPFEGANALGLEDNELGLPASASVDVLWTGSFDGHEAALARPAEVTIRGLEPGRYDLELFASRAGDDEGRGRLTRFSVAGRWQDLEVSDNRSRTAVFEGVEPTGAGELAVSVAASPAGRSRFGYLGVLVLARRE